MPQTFGVKTNQTISFTSTAPGAASVGGATYTPAATATSGLAVTITLDGSSTGCSLNAGVRQLPDAWHLRPRRQPGRQHRLAAPQAQQSFTVNKGNQTITFTSTAPGAATVGGATYTAAATASSGLTVAFSLGIDERRHLLAQRLGLHLRGQRHLHRRRQPGRQRQLNAAPTSRPSR